MQFMGPIGMWISSASKYTLAVSRYFIFTQKNKQMRCKRSRSLYWFAADLYLSTNTCKTYTSNHIGVGMHSQEWLHCCPPSGSHLTPVHDVHTHKLNLILTPWYPCALSTARHTWQIKSFDKNIRWPAPMSEWWKMRIRRVVLILHTLAVPDLKPVLTA